MSEPSSVSTDDRLNPEAKAKWLEALRSGRYAQARESLRNSDGFCCLGVLCDATNPNGWSGQAWSYKGSTMWETSLPVNFMNEINLAGEMEDNLINMNDRQGKSFSQIADWIEAHL